MEHLRSFSKERRRFSKEKYNIEDAREIQELSIFYTNEIEEHLQQLFKRWFLIPLEFPRRPFKKYTFRSIALKYARWYFYNHNNKAKIYKFPITQNLSFSVKYQSPTGKNISKGTAFDSQSGIINEYFTTLKFGKFFISSIRFGTDLESSTKIQFRKIVKMSKPFDRVIYISLITNTQFKIGFIKALADATIREPRLALDEYEYFSNPNKKFIPIFIQMSNLHIIKTGYNVDYEFEVLVKLQEWLNDEGIDYTIPHIFLNKKSETFDNIVEISHIHWLLNTYGKKRYGTMFHCRSGKDRTGIVDAISKATYLELYKTDGKRIDMNRVRKYTRFFLLFSLMIANRSLANFGLKLSRTLKHIVKEFLTPEDIKWFEGIAYYI